MFHKWVPEPRNIAIKFIILYLLTLQWIYWGWIHLEIHHQLKGYILWKINQPLQWQQYPRNELYDVLDFLMINALEEGSNHENGHFSRHSESFWVKKDDKEWVKSFGMFIWDFPGRDEIVWEKGSALLSFDCFLLWPWSAFGGNSHENERVNSFTQDNISCECTARQWFLDIRVGISNDYH